MPAGTTLAVSAVVPHGPVRLPWKSARCARRLEPREWGFAMTDRRFRGGNIRAALMVPCSLVLLTSCAAILATKIADIKKTPGTFEGRTLTISGKVTSTHDLLVVKYYMVDDGTGEIPVVTESALPKEGQSVSIKGRVNQAFAIGTARLVVVVEEPPPR
jgi:hypothetical protein